MNFNLVNLSYILLIFFLLSCQSQQGNMNNKSLSSLKHNINSEYYNHFPSLSESDDTRLLFVEPDSEGVIKSYTAFLITTINDSLFLSNNKIIEESSIIKYKPSDNCLLMVNLFGIQIAGDIFIENYQTYCVNEYYPVPNFLVSLSGIYSGIFSKEGKLTDDFTLFILEADTANIIENNILNKAIGLPERWNHGYCKGVAINKNDNMLIYWIEAW